MAQISKYEIFHRFVQEALAGTGHYPTYPAITAALGLSPRTIAKYFRLLRQESLFPAPPQGEEPPPSAAALPPPPSSPITPSALPQQIEILRKENSRLGQLAAAAQARLQEQEQTIARLHLLLGQAEAKLVREQERYIALVAAGKEEIKELVLAVLKNRGSSVS